MAPVSGLLGCNQGMKSVNHAHTHTSAPTYMESRLILKALQIRQTGVDHQRHNGLFC